MRDFDVIVIGSGFGGTMAAYPLVNAGSRVLMLERGGWVARGPDNWGARGAGLVTEAYTKESRYDIVASGKRYDGGAWHCVGGQSVYYGGASYRYRESDFDGHSDVVQDSGASWPFAYGELEPFYCLAEHLLSVSGADDDPTSPPRNRPYPQGATPLSESATRIASAARRLGFTPSRIPLAISFSGHTSGPGCLQCGTCDGYACAVEAKNDVATTVIPRLIARGMTLRENMVCVRLERRKSRIVAVECVHRLTGERARFTADQVILAAGTLASPHLLLASGLGEVNPAGDAIGRYLTRHCNAVVLGAFARQPNPSKRFDKQVAIMDFYGDAGSIQQWTPAEGIVRAYLPAPMGFPAAVVLSHSLGLMVIAEDQPRRENAIALLKGTDRYGLPRLRVRHAYSDRDESAARQLVGHSKRILREAGALFSIVRRVHTLSHALGTVRMGEHERTSPLDGTGRFRGLDNLYVSDGSALPRSAAVNPSLTIAAHALRVGAKLAHPTISPMEYRRSLPVWHREPSLVSR